MSEHKPLQSVVEWVEKDRLAFERAENNLREFNSELAELEVEVTTPDGGVTIEMSGGGELRKISIDPDAYHEYEPDQLADLVIAGMAATRREARRAQSETFREVCQNGDGT